MKIVYCLPDTYKPGGIERVVSLKANYLADVLGYEVFIITTGQQNKESYYWFSDKIKFIDLSINYDETLSLPIYKRVYKRWKKKNLHKQQLTHILYSLRADIVISTFTHEVDFLRKIRDGSKKILEFHFFRGHKITYANSFGFSLLTKLGYYYKAYKEQYFLVRKYDQFVVLTEEDKESWLPFCRNVISIPNIISFNMDSIAELNNKVVLSVGRLDPQKGFDRLIKLWPEIAMRFPDWKLFIFGSGPYQNKLEQLISDLKLTNQIKIFPPEKKIIDQYLRASIYTMTSRYEGMPMTLLEAGVCGLPSIVYDFKCGPKDVIVNNENGFIIKEDDSKKFVEKMTVLMDNDKLRKEMGKKASQLSIRYTEEVIMCKWNKLFRNLLGVG